jgi:hypothetical protein
MRHSSGRGAGLSASRNAPAMSAARPMGRNNSSPGTVKVVQADFGAHSASYPMGLSLKLTVRFQLAPRSTKRQSMHTPSCPGRLHAAVLNYGEQKPPSHPSQNINVYTHRNATSRHTYSEELSRMCPRNVGNTVHIHDVETSENP